MSNKQIIEIPCRPFNLKLSHWDIRFPPVHSRRLLCFELNSNASQTTVVFQLHRALQSTIAELPYLAGSIVPHRSGASWLRDIQAQGSAKLIVQDVSAKLPAYSDLKSQGLPQPLLDHTLLCPFDKIIYRQDEPVDVCRLQANFLHGGLILTVSIINVVSDGGGITETVRKLAENLRSVESTQPIGHNDSLPMYSVDRTALLNGRGIPGDIGLHPAWSTASKPAYSDPNAIVTTRHNYQISASNILLLKQNTLSALPPNKWISTHDAIMALLWRSLIAARYKANHITVTDHTQTSITTAVDCRTLMGLPSPYHGNAIYAINPSLPRSILLDADDGLTTAALSIRQAIQDVTRAKFQDLLGFAERTENDTPTTLSVLPQLQKGGIFLTSHFGFELCGMDFGPSLGKVDACWQPTSSVMPGTPHILPRLLDGSCVLMLNEGEDVMRCLAEDEVWSKYAVAMD